MRGHPGGEDIGCEADVAAVGLVVFAILQEADALEPMLQGYPGIAGRRGAKDVVDFHMGRQVGFTGCDERTAAALKQSIGGEGAVILRNRGAAFRGQFVQDLGPDLLLVARRELVRAEEGDVDIHFARQKRDGADDVDVLQQVEKKDDLATGHESGLSRNGGLFSDRK
ncbi:hypothetical protein D3C80_912580 [compost metagenome]